MLLHDANKFFYKASTNYQGGTIYIILIAMHTCCNAFPLCEAPVTLFTIEHSGILCKPLPDII